MFGYGKMKSEVLSYLVGVPKSEALQALMYEDLTEGGKHMIDASVVVLAHGIQAIMDNHLKNESIDRKNSYSQSCRIDCQIVRYLSK